MCFTTQQTWLATNQVVAESTEFNILLFETKFVRAVSRPQGELILWRNARAWRNFRVILSNRKSVSTVHNLQKPDLLQDRFESWVVKCTTSLKFRSYFNNVGKRLARCCCPISLRDLAFLTNYPSHSTRLRQTAVTFTSITLRFPPCLSLTILTWLLASKVNVELSKRMKFTVKSLETVSKGFLILLEKFGCGCTQQSWRQWNKGEQIFHLFCFVNEHTEYFIFPSDEKCYRINDHH